MLPNDEGAQCIEAAFPNISITGYKITSPVDPSYNCIAWAAEDENRFWWPKDEFGYYWPNGVERRVSMDTFVKAYQSLGFEICDNQGFEEGFQKIVIYTNDSGQPTHAARMIDERTWTSKLGSSHDISHTITGLDGGAYGRQTLLMKRPAP